MWTHTQGVFVVRDALAQALGIESDSVRVVHVVGPGCYGHNGADDAVLDAALLARAVPGRAVLLKWMREDEHAWEPYGPPMVVEVQASVDAAGRLSTGTTTSGPRRTCTGRFPTASARRSSPPGISSRRCRPGGRSR